MCPARSRSSAVTSIGWCDSGRRRTAARPAAHPSSVRCCRTSFRLDCRDCRTRSGGFPAGSPDTRMDRPSATRCGARARHGSSDSALKGSPQHRIDRTTSGAKRSTSRRNASFTWRMPSRVSVNRCRAASDAPMHGKGFEVPQGLAALPNELIAVGRDDRHLVGSQLFQRALDERQQIAEPLEAGEKSPFMPSSESWR